MAATFHVISHTHWDREWYQTFEQFRLRLVDLIDNLLEIFRRYPGFRFHLDAQTIIFEDYLAVKPDTKAELAGYVREGRIFTGPWYVQNDFYLTSGEATVRNLLIGTEAAEELGGCTKVGYVPDQFGLISQLPQILRGFGIDTALFGRGWFFEPRRKAEFRWRGPDGSEVLAVNMPFWYNNAQRFPENIDQAQRLVDGLRQYLAPLSATDHLLLMNGVDHLEAQENLMPILDSLAARLPKGERIIQSSMGEYMEALREALRRPDAPDLAEHTGELRYGNEHQILAGTLSSRAYLKQLNHQTQLLLERRLEPLFSSLALSGLPEYPREHLRYLRKLLLQNHPHDDICGCSVDAVHAHMVDRYHRVEEAGCDLLQRGMHLLIDYLDRDGVADCEYLLAVFNPLPFPRSEVVEAVVEVAAEEDRGGFGIRDSEGEEIIFSAEEGREKAKGLLSPVNLPGVTVVRSYAVRLWAEEIPAAGYRTYVVTPDSGQRQGERGEESRGHGLGPGPGPQAREAPEAPGSAVLENEHLRVTVNANGSIDVEHRETGRTHRGLLVLEDREDAGDAYIYRSDPRSMPMLSDGCRAAVSVQETGPLRKTVSVAYSLSVPVYYDFGRGERSAESVEIPVRVLVSLSRGAPWAEAEVSVDNCARDHRMRLLFPTGLQADLSHAGAPFDVVRRSRADVVSGKLAVARQPCTEMVALQDGSGGLAVFTDGLYEYEHTEDGTLALTLFRGNGFISNDQSSLPVQESWLVPGNQCLGPARYRVAVCPYAGSLDEAGIPLLNQRFQTPPLAACKPADRRKMAGGRPFVQDSRIDAVFFRERKHPQVRLPRDRSHLALEGQGLVLSALKGAEKGGSLVVRIYNTADRDAAGSLTVPPAVESVYRVSLAEEREDAVALESGVSREGKRLHLALRPKEIVTLELVTAPPPTSR